MAFDSKRIMGTPMYLQDEENEEGEVLDPGFGLEENSGDEELADESILGGLEE